MSQTPATPRTPRTPTRHLISSPYTGNTPIALPVHALREEIAEVLDGPPLGGALESLPFATRELQTRFTKAYAGIHRQLVRLETFNEVMVRMNESVDAYLFGLFQNAWCVHFDRTPGPEEWAKVRELEALRTEARDLEDRLRKLRAQRADIPLRASRASRGSRALRPAQTNWGMAPPTRAPNRPPRGARPQQGSGHAQQGHFKPVRRGPPSGQRGASGLQLAMAQRVALDVSADSSFEGTDTSGFVVNAARAPPSSALAAARPQRRPGGPGGSGGPRPGVFRAKKVHHPQPFR